MTDDRIEKIKSAVESAESIPADKKAELLRLLSKLQPAIARVSQTHHEDAESIARLVEVSAHATKASASGVKISEKAGVISPKTSTPEGRGLRLSLAMVEGVVIKIETLPQFAAADTFARGVFAPLRCCVVAGLVNHESTLLCKATARQARMDTNASVWGAHAPRVLATAPSPSHTWINLDSSSINLVGTDIEGCHPRTINPEYHAQIRFDHGRINRMFRSCR
jgi:hypothetical protein